MGTQTTALSRPLTPESPLTSSLHRASNTIDDLTLALTNISRVPSPEPSTNVTCCCDSEECENSLAWHDLKSRLENQLTLSAEVGQALLQRHEAYVRRHEARCRIKQIPESHRQDRLEDTEDDEDATKVFQEQLDVQFAELVKEKELLEKKLNQALVNNEVTEVSNKTLLQELHDSQTTISRLTAHHARSIGWDTRLTAALKERDDMQQERDSESHRARLAESRFAALKDKTIKLQTEVRRLQEALEEKRSHRLESSETLLQDVRARLESIRDVGQHTTLDGYEEIDKILESLVQDNETLKHDNDELQHLLAESREDFAALHEEFEEYKANPPSLPRSGANTPHSRHLHRASVTSVALRDYPVFTNDRKSRRLFEPPTPDTSRPLSPPSPDPKWNPFGRGSSPLSPSRYSFEVEVAGDDQENSSTAEKRRIHKPLLLLSRSRSVQTDPYPVSLLSPSPLPSFAPSLSPHDHSEASSFSESSSVQITNLIERAVMLLNRMTQTDPLTLTNRLKRQHLKGADIGHLSKTTIGNVLNEVSSLRQQYRSLLEEDKAALPVTRKDLRLLFKFLRDVFTELGQIRSTLNEIILDPSLAAKISQQALYPDRGEKEIEKDKLANPTNSWIAPISRLFTPQRGTHPPPATLSNFRPRNTRLVPKLGPALAASATTVNVEFSGIGGRSTTSASGGVVAAQRAISEGTTGVMDIFAGAPAISTSTSTSTDTWIVVPPSASLRRVPSLMKLGVGAMEPPSSSIADQTRTIGRNTILPIPKPEILKNLDAVIDERIEAEDQLSPLLQRTLRRRGLSDSSIHSTYMSHGRQQQEGQPTNDSSGWGATKQLTDGFKAVWPDSSSVLQVLSRTVQNLKMGGTGGSGSEPNTAANSSETSVPVSPPSAASEHHTPEMTTWQTQTPPRVYPQIQTQGPSPSAAAEQSLPSHPIPVKSPKKKKSGTLSPRKGIAPGFSSWAATSFMLDPVDEIRGPFIGSFREDSFLNRPHRPGGEI